MEETKCLPYQRNKSCSQTQRSWLIMNPPFILMMYHLLKSPDCCSPLTGLRSRRERWCCMAGTCHIDEAIWQSFRAKNRKVRPDRGISSRRNRVPQLWSRATPWQKPDRLLILSARERGSDFGKGARRGNKHSSCRIKRNCFVSGSV